MTRTPLPERGAAEPSSVAIDIELSKATERESARPHLLDALESVFDAIVYYDADERLVYCNSRYREFYPWIADLMIPGTSFTEITRAAAERGQDAEPIEDLDAWIEDRLTKFRATRNRHEQHLRDGRWVLCSENRTADGGTVGIRTDITERKQAAEELAGHRDELEQRVAERTAALTEANARLEREIAEREQADAALRVSEERYRDLVDGSNLGISIDKDYRPLYVNQTLVEMLRFDSIDELLSIESLLEWVAPHDREQCLALNSARRKGDDVPGCYEFDAVRKDGVHVRFEAVVRLIDWGGQRAVQMVVHDITGRRRLEEANRQLREAVDRLNSGFALWDQDDRLLLCNQTYKDIFHQLADLIVPGVGFDHLAKAMIERQVLASDFSDPSFIERRLDARAHGQGIEYQLSDGRWIHCVDSATADGTQISLRVDVTDRKTVEKAARETEGLFASFHENSPMAFFLKDLEGKFTLVNKTFCRWYGISQDDVIGKTSDDIYPKEYAEEYRGLDRQVVAQGNPVKSEAVIPFDDGSIHNIEITKFPVFDGDGAPVGIGTINADITTQKRVEHELRSLNEELEERVAERTRDLEEAQGELLRSERLATLGQLTATVSHELRNPLGAMRPSVYILKKRVDDTDPKVAAALQRLERGITRCDRIIDELLDFSRIRELATCRTVIDEWLGEVLNELPVPDSVCVEKVFGLGELALTIDPDCLRRAVINVYANAWQALVAEDERPVGSDNPVLTVSTGCYAGIVEIEISDNGPGIAGDVLPKVFEPLYSTKGFGVGLGLPIAKQILIQHGGEVEIHGRADRGTRVVLKLPADVAPVGA